MDRDQQVLESKVVQLQPKEHGQAQHYERRRQSSVVVDGFNRRHSQISTAKRGSFTVASFEKSNIAMVFPDKTNLEVDDSYEDSIEDTKTSWFVWLIAFTASIAGSLFGYDTGIISAVLVYLGTDLNSRETSPNEKELITSLCSGGAFIGAIIAGLTADKFVSLLFSLKDLYRYSPETFLWQ
jgi:MFS transporter, SP family, solute carrier family 2 (myo-inositol transporter), member 13